MRTLTLISIIVGLISFFPLQGGSTKDSDHPIVQIICGQEKIPDVKSLKSIIEKEAEIKIPNRLSDEHFLLMMKEAKKNGIPFRIYFRLIYIESRFDSSAISPKGARGYMQIMPRTFAELEQALDLSGWTPENNIRAGSYFLGKLHKEWLGKTKDPWALALAAYNSGPGRVRRLRRIPNISETLRYVAYINRKDLSNEKTI